MNQPMKSQADNSVRRLSAGRVGAVLGVVAILLAVFSVTVIETGQVGVVIRSGSDQPRVMTEPGVYIHVPFVERVWLIDTRLQISEQPVVQAYTTSDNQRVQLAGWLAWRVSDPVHFSTATANGKKAIDEQLFKAFSEVLTDWLKAQTAAGLLAGPKDESLQRWLTELNQRLMPMGVQAEQAGLRQAMLTDTANEAIYQRMAGIRTRNSRLLMDGLASDESQLVALQTRQQNQVLDDAYRAAQVTRQNAENQLISTYTRQYGTRVDFAAALNVVPPTPAPATGLKTDQ